MKVVRVIVYRFSIDKYKKNSTFIICSLEQFYFFAMGSKRLAFFCVL
jgi:hypothetical protein